MSKSIENSLKSLAKVGKLETDNLVFDNSIKIVIFLDKKYHNSPEQVNWIRRAKLHSFPNANVTALFIKDKQKSPAIVPMKHFTDHRWSLYHERRHHKSHAKKHRRQHHRQHTNGSRRHISDEEYYKQLRANKFIDNVFMINHHFDLNMTLNVLNSNRNMSDRAALYGYQPESIYFFMTHNDVIQLYEYYTPHFKVDSIDALTDFSVGFNLDLSRLTKPDPPPAPADVATPVFSAMPFTGPNDDGEATPRPRGLRTPAANTPPRLIIPQSAFQTVFCNTFVVPKFGFDGSDSDSSSSDSSSDDSSDDECKRKHRVIDDSSSSCSSSSSSSDDDESEDNYPSRSEDNYPPRRCRRETYKHSSSSGLGGLVPEQWTEFGSKVVDIIGVLNKSK